MLKDHSAVLFVSSLPTVYFASLLHVFVTVAVALVVLLIAATLLLASRKHKMSSFGELSPVGKCGTVEATLEPEGAVRVNGEVWRARSANGTTLVRGASVKVVGVRKLLLEVEAAERD